MQMETTTMSYVRYRTWGKRGSHYNIPKAIFYLLKGDYSLSRAPRPIPAACLGSPALHAAEFEC